LPQLDVSTFPSQIFWLIICFSVLYYLLSRRALPRVSEILEARQDRIAADLDQAQRLRRDAEVALAAYEEAMAKAQDRAQSLLAETQNRLQAEAAARQAELDQQLARQLSEAEGRIAASRDRALAELEDGAIDVAQAAAAKLAGVTVSAEVARRALRAVRQEAA
jgi:F-type H+-transporting ATPase subunit b